MAGNDLKSPVGARRGDSKMTVFVHQREMVPELTNIVITVTIYIYVYIYMYIFIHSGGFLKLGILKSVWLFQYEVIVYRLE